MPVKPADKNTIQEAASILQRGGLVAFPTETVYGLGVDAFNADAAARLFEVKGRPRFDPLIVHLHEAGDLARVSATVPPGADKLMTRFWPGPLTLIFPKHPELPGLVTSGLPTVAVRVPAHPVARALIEACGCPVAAPSANPFGYLSPTTAAHVAGQLEDKVDLILDGGPASTGVESTIIDLSSSRPVVLRHGGIPAEEIEAVTGPLSFHTHSPSVQAPGQLEEHYAPRTPIRLCEELPPPSRLPAASGALVFQGTAPEGYRAVEVLSEKGDLRQAAAALFAALHRLDSADLELIAAGPVPEHGLGRAIMDRLRRAAVRFHRDDG